MTMMVVEVYDALRNAGVADDMARAAAKAVIGVEDRALLATKADLSEMKLATKADLSDMKAALSDMKAELIKWNAGLLVAMTAIFAGIVKLL